MTYPIVDSGSDSINPTGLDGNFYLYLGNCLVVILLHRLYRQWVLGRQNDEPDRLSGHREACHESFQIKMQNWGSEGAYSGVNLRSITSSRAPVE
jgi:hypothetical protein